MAQKVNTNTVRYKSAVFAVETAFLSGDILFPSTIKLVQMSEETDSNSIAFLSQEMVDDGIRSLRAAMTKTGRYIETAGSKAKTADRAVVIAVYRAMEAERRNIDTDIEAPASAPIPALLRGRYNEIEIDVALGKTLDAYTRYIVGMGEYGISEKDQQIIVRRVGQYLRQERNIDTSDLWDVF